MPTLRGRDSGSLGGPGEGAGKSCDCSVSAPWPLVEGASAAALRRCETFSRGPVTLGRGSCLFSSLRAGRGR